MTEDVAAPVAAQDDGPAPSDDAADQAIQAQADGDENTEIQVTEPETVTVEYDGKQYAVPPELKDALLRQADYTRKTQDVADQRRQVEADREALTRAKAEDAQLQEDIGQAAYLSKLLADYQKVDWQAFQRANPEEANRQWLLYQQIKDQRDTAKARIEETKQKRTLETQQLSAKQFEEGQRVLQRDIKGWNAELAGKLVEFGLSNGLSRAEVDALGTSPAAVKLLHQAWLADQTLKQAAISAQKAAAKPATVAAAPVTQVTKARSGPAPSAGPSDSDSIEDWVKKRNAQLRRRR